MIGAHDSSDKMPKIALRGPLQFLLFCSQNYLRRPVRIIMGVGVMNLLIRVLMKYGIVGLNQRDLT